MNTQNQQTVKIPVHSMNGEAKCGTEAVTKKAFEKMTRAELLVEVETLHKMNQLFSQRNTELSIRCSRFEADIYNLTRKRDKQQEIINQFIKTTAIFNS